MHVLLHLAGVITVATCSFQNSSPLKIMHIGVGLKPQQMHSGTCGINSTNSVIQYITTN